jgi:hypothetical protein
MTKLADVFKKHGINERRLLAVSKKLEHLRPEDRAIQLARRRAKSGSEKDKELAAKPSRSGHAVSAPALNAALQGKDVSRRTKQRIAKALNAILEKKGATLKSSDLF